MALWLWVGATLAAEPVVPVGAWPGYRFGSASKVAVIGSYAYLAAWSRGLFTVDIADPAHPRLVHELTGHEVSQVKGEGDLLVALGTGGVRAVDLANPRAPRWHPVASTGLSSADLDLSGRKAFVAGRLGVVVVDFSDPTAPRVGSNYSTGDGAVAVAARGGRVMVLDRRTGFQLLDYDAPGGPVQLTHYRQGASVGDLAFADPDGDVAYVMGWTDTRFLPGLGVLDLVNPGNNRGFYRGYYLLGLVGGPIAVSGGRAYLGGVREGVVVSDISDPRNPGYVGTVLEGMGLVTGLHASQGWIHAVDGDLHVLRSGDGPLPRVVGRAGLTGWVTRVGAADGRLVVADQRVGSRILGRRAPDDLRIETVVPFKEVSAACLVGNHLYLGYMTELFQGRLAVVDVSVTERPVSRVTNALNAVAISMTSLEDRWLLLGEGASGLAVYDISLPTAPRRVGSWSTRDAVWSVAFDGRRGYAASGRTGLEILDFADPEKPSRIGVFTNVVEARDVAIRQGTAYLAAGKEGLKVVDVRSPERPVLLGAAGIVGTAAGVRVHGSHAYVAIQEGGLVAFDVADPVRPREIARVPTRGRALSLDVIDGHAYVAEEDWGVGIFRLEAPPMPPEGAPSVVLGADRRAVFQQPLVLDGVVLGAQPRTFQWLKEGVPLTEGTNAALSFAGFLEKDEGLYQLAVANALGRTTSAPVRITLSNHPPRPRHTNSLVLPSGVFAFPLSAADPDVPLQALTYRLVRGPSGLSVSRDGMVTWMAPQGGVGTPQEFVYSITDSGQPPITVTVSLLLTLSGLKIDSVRAVRPGVVRLGFSGEPLRAFVVERADRPVGNGWVVIHEGRWTTPTASVELPTDGAAGFYRVRLK